MGEEVRVVSGGIEPQRGGPRKSAETTRKNAKKEISRSFGETFALFCGLPLLLDFKAMPVVYLTRRAVFSASHRLHSDRLSDQENRQLFGKCNRPGGHGHNYTIEVTVRGEIDVGTGIVMNLTELKAAIEETVMRRMDHRNLNTDLPEFQDLNPTAENIAVVCWKMLQKRLPEGLLHEVVIRETENNFVRYRGE